MSERKAPPGFFCYLPQNGSEEPRLNLPTGHGVPVRIGENPFDIAWFAVGGQERNLTKEEAKALINAARRYADADFAQVRANRSCTANTNTYPG